MMYGPFEWTGDVAVRAEVLGRIERKGRMDLGADIAAIDGIAGIPESPAR